MLSRDFEFKVDRPGGLSYGKAPGISNAALAEGQRRMGTCNVIGVLRIVLHLVARRRIGE
jgi:hypothetical protein